MKIQKILFPALCALLTGCIGPGALPGRATSPVSTKDLVGRWAYDGDYEETSVIIEFRPDGSFEQTLSPKSGVARVQKGTWTLDGPSVHLDDVLMSNLGKAWTPEDTHFWFTDEAGYLELYGGDISDRDHHMPLKFLGPIAPLPAPAVPNGP